MKFRFQLIIALFPCQLLFGQTIIYVDKDASEGGDGTSWSLAYKFLNDALDYVDNRSGRYDLWVAEGTYYTDEGNLYANDDQNSTYLVPSTVDSILGGFSGTETSADQADSTKYLTKLSGYIYEEYGLSGLGASNLIQTEPNNSYQLTFKDLTIVNSSDQEGSVIYITDQTDRLQTAFVNCRFPGCESTNIVFSTPSSQTVSFLQCHFTNCVSSGGKLFQYGNFTLCYFNRNESTYSMLWDASTIDRCFISECVMTSSSNVTGSNNQLISGYTDILSSLFYRNISKQNIIAAWSENQILHNTFVDNYCGSAGIDGSFTLGYCLFFRSGFSNASMVGGLTVGYKSTVNLPVQSAFFGFFNYWNSGYGGSGGNESGWTITLSNITDISPFAGTSIFENNFLKKYEADLNWSDVFISPTLLNGQSLSDFFNSYKTMYGYTIVGYTPEFTEALQSEQIPDPFLDSNDPLGPDGIPFTEDDGLQLDPDSQWASEVINVPTINAEYEAYDLLGNPRIVGDKTDLGAYEYTPLQDADGDGISDANDAFPSDPNETLDTDGDDLGDNQDSDDDGDGVDDVVEIAVGTDPKQYNGAFYNFVQSLGSGSYDEDDLSDSRLAGQSDVTGDPSSYGLYSEQGITDLRAGSTILQLGANNSASLELQIERSNDLSNWTADTDDLVEVQIPLSGDTEFFRFKMTE